LKSKLPNSIYQRARPVALHEIGHHVVGRVLGFRMGSVEIELLFGGHRGLAEITLSHPTPSSLEISEHIERRVQVLYAGAAAETLVPGVPTPTVDTQAAITSLSHPGQGAEHDHAKAKDLIRVLRNLRHSPTDPVDNRLVQHESDALDQNLWAKTVTLVETHADTIIGLAGGLISRMRSRDLKARMEAADFTALPAVQTLLANGVFKS